MHLSMLQMILAIAILLVYLFFMFFSPSTPVASERMDVLYNNMNLPDMIEWKALNELGKFEKNAEIVLCLIMKLGKRITLKQKGT